MTKQTEAMKLALDWLEWFSRALEYEPPMSSYQVERALREALAEQPAQQEPYCWMSPEGTVYQASDEDVLKGSIPMYLGKPPAQRKPWVGLTDVEWMNIVNKDHAWFGQRPDEVAHEVAKLVEAKLKEKNT